MAAKSTPGSDLSRIPDITFAFVESYVQSHSRSAGSSQLNKGFKYYSEGFISSLKTSSDATVARITAKCYRSQRKNEAPHNLEIFLTLDPLQVSSASCSCAIGQGQCCGHVTGTLYLVAHYKLSGLKSIPQDVAKTSLPQTWHVPRGDKIHGMAIQEVKVTGYGKDTSKDRHQPIKSTLYNPVRTALPALEDFFHQLGVVNPSSSLLTTLPSAGMPFPASTPTKFGPFPKGSAISYQQKLSPSFLLNLVDAHFPDLPISNDNVGDNMYSAAFTESQTAVLESLSVTQAEAVEIEQATRLQADDKKWKRLRVHRITASKVGEISKRKKTPEEYGAKYKSSTRECVTGPMREGIANEPVAATAYSAHKGDNINIYPSGIVISPKAPWLAATLDRKVLDPSTDPPFGLLEIKCPDVSSKELHQLKYLTKINGELFLRKNDNYYHQIQMQLAMTGLMWCDFYIWSTKGTHLERIHFNKEAWQKVKDDAEKFYFSYII